MGKGVKTTLSIGDKFNKLTVIGECTPYSVNNRKRGIRCLCRCDCGKEGYYYACKLKSGCSTKCINCAAKEKMTHNPQVGDIFGALIVIDAVPIRIQDGKKTKRYTYKCKCKCGNEQYYRVTNLATGKALRCPTCAYKTRPQSTEKYTSLERLYNLSIVSRCKATDGRIENHLTLDEFEKIISQDCFYCGESPKEMTYLNNNKIVKNGSLFANGIDRQDSSKHYTIDNVVPCCKQCNIMKMDMRLDEFKNKIKILYERWIKQEDIQTEK